MRKGFGGRRGRRIAQERGPHDHEATPAGQLLAQDLIDHLRVCLALTGFHYLTDKEPEQFILASLVFGNLSGMGGNDGVHHIVDRRAVCDLPKPPGLDDVVGAAFTIPHGVKHFLGDFAGNCAVLYAVQQAAEIYRKIEAVKGADNFVTEVSMDETDMPQTPLDMLFILAAISDEGIPAQTIAPKFTGRFNKGVDYVGDVDTFEREFNDDLAVIRFAVKEFSLPENLKLSVHSGSDKFSIYEPIKKAIKRFDAGLHLKTAGTTWLEELIGLAEAGGSGLEIAKEVYSRSLDKFDALCAPYATVIDIDKSELPSAEAVSSWDGATYASTLRHDQSCGLYNPNFRQLLHVGYKVAADMGERYLSALQDNADVVGRNVTENILERHLLKVF